MTKYLFDIDGVLCEGRFETRGDAIIGGHGRLGGKAHSTVRVGEVRDAGIVAWLGRWRHDDNAVWRPE
jgi:hypothetical protein